MVEVSLNLKYSMEFEVLGLLHLELQLELMDFFLFLFFTDQLLKSHRSNVICLLHVSISSTFLLSAKV